mgnify:CR=1
LIIFLFTSFFYAQAKGNLIFALEQSLKLNYVVKPDKKPSVSAWISPPIYTKQENKYLSDIDYNKEGIQTLEKVPTGSMVNIKILSNKSVDVKA